MAEYGLTSKGPNIKRLDVILNEMHDELSEKWGVNTRQNPQSYVNTLLTAVADKIAELWEMAEDVYYSQYPMTAEGISLDNAAQYGGTTRETAARSYYPIHCTGLDGTLLATGTIIASTTNPQTQLALYEQKEITRRAFNEAVIRVAAAEERAEYTVAINGAVFSYVSESADEYEILRGLAEKIEGNGFSVNVSSDRATLTIASNDPTSSNVLVLSENLTTDTVTSIVTFGTVDTGDILLPDGVITDIIKADAGLMSVVNRCAYVAGHDEEDDTSLRQSYADKIFNRSTTMLESIRSAILTNVQGVSSVAPYENDTDETDALGRPPHSIEIVVDGGDSYEIAQQIMKRKAGGISTYGDTTVILNGDYDEDMPIRFSRPTDVYVYYRLDVTISDSEALPPNYSKLLKDVILEHMDRLSSGDDVVPQQFVSEFYAACSGISYVDVTLAVGETGDDSPEAYGFRSVTITARERAVTTEAMIEVEING